MKAGTGMFLKALLVTGLATATAATLGTIASQDVDSRWYRKLKKPSIQPPPTVFPVVWTALYSDIAVTSAAVLSAPQKARGYRPALLVNLTLNTAWSWCFFKLHNLPLSLGVAAALAASSTDLARRAGRVNPALGWALVPYAVWCTFATVLTGRIRQLNA